MASEVEIIPTIGKELTPNLIISEFNALNSNVLDNFFPNNFIHGLKTFDNAPIDPEYKIAQPGGYYYFYGSFPERTFALQGPNVEAFNEIFTAVDVINDSPAFEESQVKSLAEKAEELNYTFRLRWGFQGPKGEAFAFTLALCVAKVTGGIINNNLGTSMKSGCFLFDDWVIGLKNYIASERGFSS